MKNFKADIDKVTALQDEKGDAYLCRKGINDSIKY